MRTALDLTCMLGLAFALATRIPHAVAQDVRPAEPPPAAASSGLFDEIGKILKSPVDLLPSFPKVDAPPPEPPKAEAASAPPAPAATAPKAPPAEAPKDSTRTFPGMVTGRELCPRGANGAPDCQAGSDKLCQSKGYKSGKSLNTDSAFSCSARLARAEGGKPCGNEHFVTSAFCN